MEGSYSLSALVMIGGLLLGSAVLCHAVAVEVTVFTAERASAFVFEWAAIFAVERAAVSAVEQAAALAVEWAAASVAWAVASAAGCDAQVAWAWVEMFAVVDAV